MRPTELPRNVPSGWKSGAKLLRLKLNSKQPAQQQQHTEPVSSQGTGLGSSSSSSSTLQQPASLLYSAQLWQATGYKFQRETVSRAYYFPDELHPQPVHKQLPPEGAEAGQQKRSKLSNGQYRQRVSLAAAEPQQPVGATYRHQHNRHITPGLAAAAAAASAAAAAAAAAEHQRVSRAALVSPSSSSSRDGYAQQRRQSDGSGAEPVQLAVLPVPWPLTAGGKGRRSTRQRRTNMVQWQAILQPHAAAAGAAVAAKDVEQQGQSVQHMADLDHQHSGVLSGAQQQEQEQLLTKPWQQDTLQQQQQHLQAKQQQQQHQQEEAVALLQQLAPATPAHVKPSGSAFAAAAAVAGSAVAAAAVAAKQDAAAENAAAAGAAAGDSSPHETSTSSEQTHDDMNESPRNVVRQQLSSWPSSSTDSVCQLQQQQQLLQQLQQGKQGAAAPAAAAGGWASPSSPLPASAL